MAELDKEIDMTESDKDKEIARLRAALDHIHNYLVVLEPSLSPAQIALCPIEYTKWRKQPEWDERFEDRSGHGEQLEARKANLESWVRVRDDFRKSLRTLHKNSVLTLGLQLRLSEPGMCRIIGTDRYPRLNGSAYVGEELLSFIEAATRLIDFDYPATMKIGNTDLRREIRRIKNLLLDVPEEEAEDRLIYETRLEELREILESRGV